MKARIGRDINKSEGIISRPWSKTKIRVSLEALILLLIQLINDAVKCSAEVRWRGQLKIFAYGRAGVCSNKAPDAGQAVVTETRIPVQCTEVTAAD